ncbi:MAG: ABC transporter permease [Caulobacter sp.]|nr:ABC transporter permease [Caulobacter sp.]
MRAFVAAYLAAWRAILSSRPAASMLLLAVVAYAFYYPMAYRSQVATRLPIAVVDQDHSGLSRKLVQHLSGANRVSVAMRTGDFAQAQAALQRRQVDAIILVPSRLERGVLTGAPATGLAVYVNGAYLVRASTVGATVQEVLAGAVEETVGPIARAAGVRALIPVKTDTRPMFNVAQGYGSYVVPGVSVLIIHQTLLMGIVVLAAGRRGGIVPTRRDFLGVAAAFATIGVAGCLFYFGFVFWLQDYPRGGNLLGMLLATALYVPAVVFFALFLGSAFDRPERSAQVLAASSVPFFFLSGLAWPFDAMPPPLAWAARLIPSTDGIQAFVKLNQMGASVAEVWPELAMLAALAVGYGLLAWWRWRPSPDAERESRAAAP